MSLFIVDELQLIGGEQGPTLEVVTSRQRHLAFQVKKATRIIGLSASVANARELGEWIGAAQHGLFNFPPGDWETGVGG